MEGFINHFKYWRQKMAEKSTAIKTLREGEKHIVFQHTCTVKSKSMLGRVDLKHQSARRWCGTKVPQLLVLHLQIKYSRGIGTVYSSDSGRGDYLQTTSLRVFKVRRLASAPSGGRATDDTGSFPDLFRPLLH